MPRILMPDGTVAEFPDDMSVTTIRGKIAHRFPREVGALGAAIPRGQRSMEGHRDFGTEDQGASDAIGAYALNAVDGIPVAGPALTATTKGAASILPAIVFGQPFGEVYDQIGRKFDQMSRDHPIASTAGRMTGAVVGTLPLMRAAPAAFGLAGNIGTRMFASASSGGALAAADNGVRTGGDADAMRQGAMEGAAAGALGSGLGPLVGKGAQAVAEQFQLSRIAKALGLDKAAAKTLRNAAQADALTPNEARAALDKLGADAMWLDLGPNMKDLAAELASISGEAKRTIRNGIAMREADANQRIRASLQEQLGPSPVPSLILDRIERNQQALQPQYREVLRTARPANTDQLANYLDVEAQSLRGEAQNAILHVRYMLNNTDNGLLETKAGILLEARKAVDGMLKTAQDSGTRSALEKARLAIDDTLVQATPRIREVDAINDELIRQKVALQRGPTVFDGGREAMPPLELKQEFSHGALPHGRLIGPSAAPSRLRQSARAEIERRLATSADDRVALQDVVGGTGDWNRAKMSTLFGKEKAGAIVDIADREQAFANTSNWITRNSEPAARYVRQGLLGAGGVGEGARGAAGKWGKKVVDAMKTIKTDQIRGQIAEALVSRNPAIDALTATPFQLPVSQIDRVVRALLLAAPLGSFQPIGDENHTAERKPAN
nr:MAG TPA: hypothetical protein [Caudoviricetes sp.]DAK00529.1 MAG TPA: hypothetical protein [Caudoviricetes sp.]